MRHKTDPGKNGFLITGLIMMVISLSIQATRIWVSYLKTLDTLEKKSDFYLSLFPPFLQKSSTLSLTAFLLSAAAFIFCIFSLKRVRKSFRWMAYVCIFFSLAIGILSIFQLIKF